MSWRTVITGWLRLGVIFYVSSIVSPTSSSSDIPTVSEPYYSQLYARKNEEFRISCPVSQTTFVDWYKDHELMYETDGIRFRADSNRFILILNTITADSAGVYSCKAVNGYGSLHRLNFTLHVLDEGDSIPPPEQRRIIRPGEFSPNFENPPGPANIQLEPGSSQKLRCRANGNPRPQVDWYKNDRRLQPTQNTMSENFLKLNNVQEGDAGQYKCLVYNTLGMISFTYNVTIADHRAAEVVPPYPLNTSVTYGAPATLQCQVRSQSRPKIKWFRQVPNPTETSTQIDGRHYILVKDESSVMETEPGTYLNTLYIPRVTYQDEGLYICSGINQRGGSDISRAYLKVVPAVSLTTTRTETSQDRTGVETTWEYIFGSPSATLAVLIAIPTVIILVIAIGIIYCLNKRKKRAPVVRRQPSSMIHEHEINVPLNLNGNNASYNGHYNGKMSLSSGDPYHPEKLCPPSLYKQSLPQPYSQYSQSDGSYRSGLLYPQQLGPASHSHNSYVADIPDSDSHFSSVSHTRPQYMPTNQHSYDRDIQSDPPLSRLGHLQCPPPPPGSCYSGQW